MRWRDIRFEKPTEADGDCWGRILALHKNRYAALIGHENTSGIVAWCPTSELPAFDPIPDPPEGWRWATTDDSPNKHAKIWSHANKCWMITGGYIVKGEAYIVPIDPPAPPEPQYRPFANAAEFEPYRDRWIVNPGSGTYRRIELYGDEGAMGMSWEGLFRNRTFDDGSPCGVKVEP
jgi:hypothetical protein